MIVSVDHLTKYINDKCILKDASFTIEENAKVALIGVNGTGKSTLLRMLMEEEPMDSGILRKKKMQRFRWFRSILFLLKIQSLNKFSM